MTTRNAKTLSGLHVIAGIAVFAAMTFTLWEIWEGIRDREPLTVTDVQFSTWLHVHQAPRLTAAMFAVTYLGSTQVVSSIAAAFGLYFISRRRLYWLAALLSSVFGGMLLNKLLKYAVHRPRPFFDNPLLTLTSYSFPSGHTMMATTLYAVIATYLFAKTPELRLRVPIILGASLIILSVGFSRIYLGAHYLSDVIAAMAEGLAWLSLCLTVIYSIRRQRTAR
jgi:membrane-associated phospholipid phosphatase